MHDRERNNNTPSCESKYLTTKIIEFLKSYVNYSYSVDELLMIFALLWKFIIKLFRN